MSSGKDLQNVPSGERLHFAMERSTIFNGKIHYFDWAMFNCYVSSPEGTQIVHKLYA